VTCVGSLTVSKNPTLSPLDEGLALAGIRAKLARARQELDQLEAEFNPFLDSHPYTITRIRESDKVWIFNLDMIQPFPVMWSVQLGEILHNLRSALDNTVHLASCLTRKKIVSGTSFPMLGDREQDIKRRRKAIRGLSNKARAYVERLQPLASNTDITKDLHALNTLWNQDKHRIVEPWGMILEGDPSGMGSSHPYDEIVFSQTVVRDGAELFRIIFTDPIANPDEVSMYGKSPIHIAFDDPTGARDRRFTDLLDSTTTVCETILASVNRSLTP